MAIGHLVALCDVGLDETLWRLIPTQIDAMQLKRTVGFLVPNYVATGATAAWHTAARVELAPNRRGAA